ncbi:MAG: hypothetical protein Q9M43_04510 [Sulfurimonas sp.]|nr:hypothetical protein [Sulfurimonas sp.]
MFKDTIEILNFTLELIKNKQVKQKPAKEIYDLYTHLNEMKKKMNLLIHFMQRDWREYNEDTQHGSRMKKWVVFVNQELYDYVDSKYMMFCKVLKLERTPFPYEGVLTMNFFNKRLNCKLNKYLDLPVFDDEMTLTLYSFNFVALEQTDYASVDYEIPLCQDSCPKLMI